MFSFIYQLIGSQVLDGMFGLAKRLFDVDVVPADGEAPIWHPDVRFFKVLKVRGWALTLLGETGKRRTSPAARFGCWRLWNCCNMCMCRVLVVTKDVALLYS